MFKDEFLVFTCYIPAECKVFQTHDIVNIFILNMRNKQTHIYTHSLTNCQRTFGSGVEKKPRRTRTEWPWSTSIMKDLLGVFNMSDKRSYQTGRNIVSSSYETQSTQLLPGGV